MNTYSEPKTKSHQLKQIKEQILLASIVNSSEDAILSKTLDGTILSWNKGAERIYGYTVAEMIGTHVSILAPEHKKQEIQEILNRLTNGDSIEQLETVRQRKDGTRINVSLTVSPILDDTGEIVAASAVGRDITERVKLDDIRNFLASIVDTSDDAILSKDQNGLIMSWNQGAQKLYGYTPEEVIGQHVSILAPPDRPDEIPFIMSRLRSGQRIDHYETIRVTKDGKRLDVSLTISPIHNSRGEVIAASAIARDITTRKRDEEEKERLMAELNSSLNHKNILLQEVYHRVKNNLQVISSLLELRSRYISSDPRATMDAFQESIHRIHAMALVHETLYRSHDLQKLDFTAYLKNLIPQLFEMYALGKQIKLNIQGSPCEFDLNHAVPLGLVFNELVTNSLKYAFNSSDQGSITISCMSEIGATRLQYFDNGPGLPDHVKFETADSFGFRIIRLLIKQLHGTIGPLNSQEGMAYEIIVPGESNKDDVSTNQPMDNR